MKVRITITIDKDKAKQIDEYAKAMNMNRSVFLEWLISNALPIVPTAKQLLESIFKVGAKNEKASKV